MPPQPLSKVKRDAGYALGPGAFPARPLLAALVAEVITLWSEIELQRGRVLAELLRATQEAAVAMYLAITSSVARRATLDAAARAVLSPFERAVYGRVMAEGRVVEAERNAFAHGLWGFSNDIPKGLLLVDYDYRLKHMLRSEEIFRAVAEKTPIRGPVSDLQLDMTRIRVYRENDLKRSVARAKAALHLTLRLASLLALHPAPPRDEGFQRLSDELGLPKPPT